MYRLAGSVAADGSGYLDRPVVTGLRNGFLAQLAGKHVCEKRVR
jgi:hypothetical protein